MSDPIRLTFAAAQPDVREYKVHVDNEVYVFSFRDLTIHEVLEADLAFPFPPLQASDYREVGGKTRAIYDTNHPSYTEAVGRVSLNRVHYLVLMGWPEADAIQGDTIEDRIAKLRTMRGKLLNALTIAARHSTRLEEGAVQEQPFLGAGNGSDAGLRPEALDAEPVSESDV